MMKQVCIYWYNFFLMFRYFLFRITDCPFQNYIHKYVNME